MCEDYVNDNFKDNAYEVHVYDYSSIASALGLTVDQVRDVIFA